MGRATARGRHVAAVMLLVPGLCAAQTVYRSVGPDGRVTYSDRPTAAQPDAASIVSRAGASPPAAGPALPYALRQTVARFPVRLYTGPGCTPCDRARQLLTTRGVPFTERTVESNEDIEALQRLTGDTSLPVATIGAQRLKGFSPEEWTQYLDVAGYPQRSQLPAGYRAPAAQPLVGTRAAVPATPAAAQAPSVPATPAPAAVPANPAGIVF